MKELFPEGNAEGNYFLIGVIICIIIPHVKILDSDWSRAMD